jgi:chromosome segregation protein
LLQLKRVEIQGFKSFCDRTEMKFHGQGIAAIVGPNGCGKSNLSDAISWVLGEQSAKSLRGVRMEDVIFAGTRDRKPLGMAQVTMTLVDPHFVADSPAANPAEPSSASTAISKAREITITRRLFRNGESEYLVNGRSARLRDIQDIFTGSGLGPESYAIIEQGRIGQILSTKPADRRAVIEEAAGITKFKTRRRLAEAKLEGAKQNLNRVFDILEEVGRQVNSLKRQAQKANRYKELRSEYVEALKLALVGRYQLLDREAVRIALEASQAAAELQRLSGEVAAGETGQAAVRETCYQTEQALTEARRRLSDQKLEAERVRGRLENQARQIADIDARLVQGEGEAQTIGARIEERQSELTSNAQQIHELSEQAAASRAQLDAKATERDQRQNLMRERERAVESGRQQVLRLMGEASALRNQLAQVEGYLASIERDEARLRRDEEAASADLARIEQQKSALSERVAARQLELESVAQQRQSVDAQLAEARNAARETRQAVTERQTELSRIRARKDSLEGILSHRAYTTESVKRLFTAIERGQASGLKPLGVLADFVEVDPRFEKATEEFLHEELEYVVVDNFDDARQGIELMRSELDGRATFLVHPDPDSSMGRGTINEPPVGPDTGITARLTDVLKLTNGLTQAPADVLPRLSRCFLARDAESAQRLSLEYPDVYFLLTDGVCYHGYAVSGGKKTSSGPLALKRELRELVTAERLKQAEFEEASQRLAALEVSIATLTEALERLRQAQQAQEKDALALDHESRKLAEETQRANSRLSVAGMELQRIGKEREKALARQVEIQQAVAAKETERQQLESAQESARTELEELRKVLAVVSEEHAAMRATLASLEERLRSAQGNRQRLEAQLAELAQRRANLAAELERRGVDRQRLLADNITLDERAGVLAREITAGEDSVQQLAAAEQQQRERLTAAEQELKTLRALTHDAQERRNRVDLELVRRQSDLAHLDEICQNQLDLPVTEAAKSVEITLDEVAVAETEEKARELSRRIEALGPVNPQALEEFEESQRRYDFLNAQRQDLLDSIRDTERAIQEIDVESKKRFSEAFERINNNFREMFKTLFNGGLGEMRLTDIENAMDSGIDIVAQPPGKKLQNVLLLSGGERAMTAMALLMAIFRYQPSPFCILDEVDAPLDEPNILRLTKLLREMSEQTQFIVITHAKRTMESAEAMYGVTMPEPGVSKLVSVKFREREQAAAA